MKASLTKKVPVETLQASNADALKDHLEACQSAIAAISERALNGPDKTRAASFLFRIARGAAGLLPEMHRKAPATIVAGFLKAGDGGVPIIRSGWMEDNDRGETMAQKLLLEASPIALTPQTKRGALALMIKGIYFPQMEYDRTRGVFIGPAETLGSNPLGLGACRQYFWRVKKLPPLTRNSAREWAKVMAARFLGGTRNKLASGERSMDRAAGQKLKRAIGQPQERYERVRDEAGAVTQGARLSDFSERLLRTLPNICRH